ncbi:hypothetical protein ACJ41O_002307 [Fusarium nematophilum]
MSPYPRGGGFHRGRGRGRGDWAADRGRGRGPYMDDRGDRYPRSRSQEGRWGRDRDDRDRMDRMDRYADPDPRRDIRDDRDPRDRELFRSKLEARANAGHESGPSSKEVSPPPVAPSAPAYGSIPNRALGVGEGYVPASAAAKIPPTAPRAFNDRPPSAGHDPTAPPVGPAKSTIHDSPPIPVGPRAQQPPPPRPSSKQWINPNLKKAPESPKMMRSPSFVQQRPQLRRDSSQYDHYHEDERRPRSSDAKSDSHFSGTDNRARSNYSAEPGEITVRSERESQSARASIDRDTRPTYARRDSYRRGPGPSPTFESAPKFGQGLEDREKEFKESQKEVPKRKRKRPTVKAVRFELSPKSAPPEQNPESDDDEDMADYFAMEIEKTEVELGKLEKPKLPTQVMARFAAMSHGSMVTIISEGEGLMKMVEELPEALNQLSQKVKEPATVDQTPERQIENDVEMTDAVDAVNALVEPPKQPEEPKEPAQSEREPEAIVEIQKPEEVMGELAPEAPPEPAKESSAAEPAPEAAQEPVHEPVVSRPEPEPKTEEMEIDKPTAEIPPVSPETALPTIEETPKQGTFPKQVEVPPTEPERPTETLLEKAHEAAPPKPSDNKSITPCPENPREAPPERPNEAIGEKASEATVEKPRDTPLERSATDVAPISVIAPNVPLQTTEAGSKPPSTPSQVDDDETESEDDSFMNIDTVRQYMSTPPLDSLPDFSCTAWDKDRDFLQTLDSDSIIDDFVTEHMDKMHLEKTTEQERDRKIYADNYVRYLDFTASNDPAAVKSRGKFSTSANLETAGVVTPEPKHEGTSGRGRRFATERDLERVLQASMREDEERKERELRMQQEKYRTDKEAIIPDMMWNQDEKDNIKYLDQSGFTPVDRLVSTWRVLPPVNNFTEEEAGLFEKRYLEAPKQWGRVADVIPHRDFGTCIQYYYMNKKDLNLKEKLKKQPKRRKRGKAKQRSSALVSELGNGEGETEESHDTGENGERRRPRRAAAPTWGFEQPPVDTDNSTPSATPSRRGGSAKGDHPEKVDGRRGRRKAKDKEPKAPKANQTLAAAPAPGKGRSRSNSRALNAEAQPPPPPTDVHRMPTQLEQPPSGIQPPFPVQQQPPIQTMERPPQIAASSISEVMAAPSLRPEPPPQPAMTTFNLAQPQPERKAPTQASSYWSVSESNDFPHLLRSFGSDWTAIAAHMGSKTAVMVKNYFVRQKDQGKAEWETIVQDADRKRSRGEKLPDPPQPSTGGRGRRYDNSAAASRPLAVAPGIDLHNEASQAKMEAAAQPPRGQPFANYGVPIAQAPVQQPLVQPPQQQPLAMQQHPGAQPVTQAMSPSTRPLRAPVRQFGFPEREREPGQRVPLPQKAPSGPPVAEPRERPLAAAQPLPPVRNDPVMEHNAQVDRQKADFQMREQQERERERERAMARQSERQTLRVKQEPEATPQPLHYEPFGHRQQGSLGGQPLARPPRETSRPPSYAPPVQQQQQQQQQQQPPSQPVRNLLSEQPQVRSPQMDTPTSRPVSSLQQRPSSGSLQEQFGSTTPQASTPVPAAAPHRPPEPRKGGLNIMSLLNDDPPPPKRINDVAGTPVRPSPTPPPQAMAGRTLPGPAPPSQMRREPEPYSPFGRAPSGGPSAMPSLKPTYADSAQPQHMGGSRASIGVSVESAAERDYYRQHPYQSATQSSTNSPQSAHRYPPPGPPGQVQYQGQGYPTSFGAAGQPPHAGSPGAAQYSLHPSSSRSREVPQHGREASWPPPAHQPPPSGHSQPTGWPSQPPPNTSQPPPQQSWPTQHPASKPQTPAPNWVASQPPPGQPHHMMRDDGRGGPYYGSAGAGMPPQQHQMQGHYPPPGSRGPEPVLPPAQAYPRYASTPGPAPPRDPREIPGRSYTPVGYDARGQPPPAGPGYPGPDPRDMQMRDARDPRDPRDPRDLMRGLRPHEDYRHPDQYRR